MRAAFHEPEGANGYRFRWTCGYLNRSWFDVVDPSGARASLELRYMLSDYEASIYNGGAEAYQRECGPLVGVLRHDSGVDRHISPELIEAFNAWRMACHLTSLQFMRERPERYGAESDWPPSVFEPPHLARDGAAYIDGAWRFTSAALAAQIQAAA